MASTTVPIYDPNRGFRAWHISEIYRGPNTGRYVPNVDDMIIDWDAGIFRVTSVDEGTGLSVYKSWKLPGQDSGVQQQDILLGVDVGAQGESFRALLDNSVTPHTLDLDGRLHVYRTTASYVKVFKGTDISEDGDVISAMYDGNGTFVGENIPLELVVMPDQNNVGVKAPQSGYTLKELDDGEVVTAVVYDDAGHAISYSKLLIKNTAFVRTTEANKRYVTGIYLESPFLSKQDDHVLEFPTNMPADTVPVTGVVSYSDGSKVRLPANSGGQFRLFGLNHFVANTAGQKISLVLTYYLGDGEYSYGAAAGGNGKFITAKYQGVTKPFEKAYSIKLFAWPRWVDDLRGYELDYYLTTLNRDGITKVNSIAAPTGNSQAFQPLTYGVKQHMTFGVDMDKVDSKYPNYRHVQTLDILLKQPGTASSDNWAIGFSDDQNPLFGTGLAAKVGMINTDNWTLDIANGFGTKEEWLNHLYYATQPLVHYQQEVKAPEPNMFIVKTKSKSFEFDIDKWNQTLTFVNDLAQGEPLLIEFIQRQYENDLYLSMAALPVHRINPPS